MRLMNYLFAAAVLALLLCGCESLPEGEPPSGGIVAPGGRGEVFGLDAAVNRMTTLVAMDCPFIVSAATPPAVVNWFDAGAGRPVELNTLPVRLWWELLGMGMIRGVPPDGGPEYRMSSAFTPVDDGAYRWSVNIYSCVNDNQRWLGEVLVSVVGQGGGG